LKKTTTDWKVVLFVVSLTELLVGGGGRLFEIGPLTLRMYLFGATQAVVWWSILRGSWRPDATTWKLFGTLAGLTAVSAGIGWFNQAPIGAIFTDVKPLLYWSNLLFYAQIINSRERLELVKACFRWSSALLAVAYLLVLLLWKFNIIYGWGMYLWALPTEELSFRGNLGFFYKGFIFLPIGIFFWLQENSYYRKFIWVFLIYLAMLLTFTRGFWLIIFSIHVLYTIFYNPKNVISWLAIVLMITSLLSVGLYVSQVDNQNFPELAEFQQKSRETYKRKPLKEWQRKLGNMFSQGFEDRESSIIDRIIQVGEVIDATTPASVFVGNGLGKGTDSRQVHMEISYLEIFHKQGIMGLTVWFGLFYALWRGFYRRMGRSLKQIPFEDDAFVFFMAAAFMFAISFLNPFINAPMGLGMLGIALISLKPAFDTKTTMA